MIIKNVLAFTEYRTFEEKDLYIEDGVFVSAENFKENAQVVNDSCADYKTQSTDDVLDGEGCYAIPGLIDIHFHGCMGADFCDGTPESIQTIANYEASQGITTILPATMTLPEEDLMQIMKNAASYNAAQGAILAGINMEGPFISPLKKGAQAPEHIRKPDVKLFQKLQKEANGLIKLCDIAPEEDGAFEFISELKDEVKISFAHTAADYDTAKKGYDLGACHATHLYNAMSPFAHRDPGVVGAASDSEHVHVELICDGIHVHPATVRATLEMFGEERVVMISDSMRATGLSDGEYTLGGQAVRVVGKLATLASDGAIAGSCTNLMDCVRTAVKEMHIPLEIAVGCATINAAKSVGIYDKYGSLTEGKVANVVLLNQDLSLKAVIIKGEQYI